MTKNLYHVSLILLIALVPFFLGMMAAKAEPVQAPTAEPFGTPTFLSLGSTLNGQPVKMLVRTAWPLKAGQQTDLVIQLWTDKGPIAADSLMPYYGKPLHLFLLSPDFRDFYYLNPFPTKNAGEYRATFTPRVKAPFRVWAEFLTDEGLKMGLADLNYARHTIDPLPNNQIVHITRGGLRYAIDFEDELLVGKPISGMLIVSNKETQTSYRSLEPINNAFAHAVAFGSDFASITHIQPLGDPPKNEKARGGPAVYFRMTPMKAGMMPVFAQFRINGRPVTIPFVVKVLAKTKKIRSEDLENKSRPEHQDLPENE